MTVRARPDLRISRLTNKIAQGYQDLLPIGAPFSIISNFHGLIIAVARGFSRYPLYFIYDYIIESAGPTPSAT